MPHSQSLIALITDFCVKYRGPLMLLGRLVLAVAIIFAARIVVRVVDRMIKRQLPAFLGRNGQSQRVITLSGLFSSAMAYCVYFCAIILILFTLDPSGKTLVPLLSFASVLGLAIGFGAQRLVRDVITGVFILGENQFDVGDHVTIGAVTGVVETMELRVTRLRDDQGRLYVIANGDITQVFNASRGNIKLPIELSLQASAELPRALELMQRLAAETLDAFHVTVDDTNLTVAVIGMDAAKMTLRLTVWVPVTDKERIEDEVRRRLLEALKTPELMLA